MKKIIFLIPVLFIGLACFAGAGDYNEENPTIGGSINTALVGAAIMLAGYLVSRVALARGLGQGLLIIGGLGVFVGVVQIIGIIIGSIVSTAAKIAVIMAVVALVVYILRSIYLSVIGRHKQESSV